MRPLERPEVPAGADKAIVDRFIQAQQKRLGIVFFRCCRKAGVGASFGIRSLGNASFAKKDGYLCKRRKHPRPTQSWWMSFWLHLDMVNLGASLVGCVHFGETHGYDKDQPRNHAWPYRDYVIRALNEDKPYAQFVREQIAGDRLLPHHRDGIEALDFWLRGVGSHWTCEVPESKIDGKVARHLDRDDMVTAVMTTLLFVHGAMRPVSRPQGGSGDDEGLLFLTIDFRGS